MDPSPWWELLGVIGLTESSQEGQGTGWTYDGRVRLAEWVRMIMVVGREKKKDGFGFGMSVDGEMDCYMLYLIFAIRVDYRYDVDPLSSGEDRR